MATGGPPERLPIQSLCAGTEPVHADACNGIRGQRGPRQATAVAMRALPVELEIPVVEARAAAVGRQIARVDRNDRQDELRLRILGGAGRFEVRDRVGAHVPVGGTVPKRTTPPSDCDAGGRSGGRSPGRRTERENASGDGAGDRWRGCPASLAGGQCQRRLDADAVGPIIGPQQGIIATQDVIQGLVPEIAQTAFVPHYAVVVKNRHPDCREKRPGPQRAARAQAVRHRAEGNPSREAGSEFFDQGFTTAATADRTRETMAARLPARNAGQR